MNIKDLKIINFPDGHSHLRDENDYIELKEISISIKSFDDLFILAQFKKLYPTCNILKINYLLGARCDRQFSKHETYDLEIIADFINSLKFKRVEILQPHSNKSLELINNSVKLSITSSLLIMCLRENNIKEHSIISPDKGASEWIEDDLGISDVIQCSKKRIDRDKLEIIIPEVQLENDCIIIDDILDGGLTFIEIAKILKTRGVNNVYLIVTHGIFSKGFSKLEKYFKCIYCTNSFSDLTLINKDEIFLTENEYDSTIEFITQLTI